MNSPYVLKAKNWFKGAIDRDFLRKIIGTFMTQVVSLGINFLSVIFISRSLGPVSRGILATVMAIITLGIQFGNMGLHASNTYFISKDRSIYSKAVGNSCLIALVLGGMISLGVFSFFARNISENSIRWSDLSLICFWIPIGLAYLLFQNILISIHEVKAYNIAEILNKGIGFLTICCIFFLEYRNAEVVLSITLFVQILALSYVWVKIKAHLVRGVSLSLSLFKKCLKYGFKSYVGCFFVYLVLKIDLLMVKHLLGFEEVGYYSVATNMADLVYIFPTIVASLLFPRIVPVVDEMERWKIVKKIAVITFLLMLLIKI